MELGPGAAIDGLPPQPGNGGVESFRLPADLVGLAVRAGGSEHGEPDGVGVAGGMGQGLPPVDADQQGDMVLGGRHGDRIVDPIVLTGVGDPLPIEQPAEDLGGLGQSGLADGRRIEHLPDVPHTR